jgi:hypothetical protein
VLDQLIGVGAGDPAVDKSIAEQSARGPGGVLRGVARSAPAFPVDEFNLGDEDAGLAR